jgi:tight adherence protein C
MIGFLMLGLFFVAICVVGLIRLITAPRARAIQRVAEIEAYGSSAQPALSTTGLGVEVGSGGLSDLAGLTGGFVVRRFGGVRESDLRAELMAAGMYDVSPRTLLGYRVLAAILFPALILALGSGSALSVVLALAMVGLGWMLPLTIIRRRARQRIDQIDRALPDLVDLLVVTVEAGLGFSGSLRVAADQFAGPLSDELRLTLQEQAMGLAMSDALIHLLRRADTPSMGSFVRSVIQGESLGVSTGTIMRNIAVEMRKRRRKAAEERAQKAPIKLLFPLVFLIFPTMFIVLLLPAIFSLQSAFSS